MLNYRTIFLMISALLFAVAADAQESGIRNNRQAQDPRTQELLIRLEKLSYEKNNAEKQLDYLKVARLSIGMSKIARELGSGDYANQFLEKAVSEFQKANRSDTLPQLYFSLAEWYEDNEEKTALLRCCRNGLEELKKNQAGISRNQADELKKKFLTKLNNFTNPQEDEDQFLRNNTELLQILSEEKEAGIYARVTNNLGMAWLQKKDFARAETYFRQAISLEEKRGDHKSLPTKLDFRINLANALLSQGQIAQAEKELQSSRGLCKDNKLFRLESRICGLLAKIKLRKNDLMQAYQLSKEGLRLAKQKGVSEDADILENALECHAEVLKRSGEFTEAFKVLEELNELKKKEISEQKKKRLKDKERKEETKQLEKKLSDFREAHLAMENARRGEEEISRRNRERLDSLQKVAEKAAYENQLKIKETDARNLALQRQIDQERFEQEKAENISMTIQKELKLKERLRYSQLEKEKMEANLRTKDSKNKEKEAIKEKEKSLLISIATGTSFLLAFFLLLQTWRSNGRLKQGRMQIESANSALASLNQELNSKNKNITDSIMYAQGIQSAILPAPSAWDKIFPDSFILYLPKDIVSGDFYFQAENEGKHIVAFADCTGHGVPGALMSMIGHNLLVSAIDVQGLTSPAEILKFLDHGLRQTLHHENRENYDGMEIGICCFDAGSGNLHFAGSRRPLYGVRKGEFFEWKGDRRHLGSASYGIADIQEYTCPISEIAEVWMVTDGYCDQFGGPDQRRIHSGHFKKILHSLAGLPSREQKEELLHFFREWKGSMVQIDDVTLIGIRLQSFTG